MTERIFVDTNPFIYFLNRIAPYCESILTFFLEQKIKGAQFFTSTITDAEFMVKPLSNFHLEELTFYREFLKQFGFQKIEISEIIAERSATIRAKYKGVKLADSLQLASSIDFQCDCFFTNDARLKQVEEAKVLYLGDLMEQEEKE